MGTLVVALVYLLTLAAAIFLVYRFEQHSWIWHAGALAVAAVLGFMPPPDFWSGEGYDLTIGAVFLFLVVWGIGGFVDRGLHLHHHHHA